MPITGLLKEEKIKERKSIMAEMDLNTNQGQIRYLTPLDISTKTERSIVDLKDLVLSTLITRIQIIC